MATPEINRDYEVGIGSNPYFDAPAALQIVDRVIENVYMPFRGQVGFETERATLVRPRHVDHMENDAEHSWHTALMLDIFWSNKGQLNLNFPDNFDVGKALRFAMIHDLPEIYGRDIDAVTPNAELKAGKVEEEHIAMNGLAMQLPFMRQITTSWKEYDRKDTPEAEFINDIDKNIATRLICHDGGEKWKRWKDSTGLEYSTPRDEMCEVMRGKMKTPFGHKLFDEIEADLDNHPEYFPTQSQVDRLYTRSAL